MIQSITNVTLIFPDERPVFLREQGSNLYSPTAYFLSKFFTENIIMFIMATIIFTTVYFSVGLNTESVKQPLIFYSFTLLLVWVGTGIGLLMGTIISDKKVVMVVTPVTIMPLFLFSGFFVNQNNILPILTPFEYLSPFKYSFQALAINEYDDLSLSCHPQCDPLRELDFDMTLEESVAGLAAVGVSVYLIAYIILLILAKRAK